VENESDGVNKYPHPRDRKALAESESIIEGLTLLDLLSVQVRWIV
jgi:hypothetical protein